MPTEFPTLPAAQQARIQKLKNDIRRSVRLFVQAAIIADAVGDETTPANLAAMEGYVYVPSDAVIDTSVPADADILTAAQITALSAALQVLYASVTTAENLALWAKAVGDEVVAPLKPRPA